MHSSMPPPNLSPEPRPWRPGDELNDKQAFLITQNAPLRSIALAADHPPSVDTACEYDFPMARLARPRAPLRLIRGGRR